ncbi:MAG: response regulator transcription factor [Acidimicrobiia bacterium]|nr:response regulator transcription factor [Acidimicrobiia bacterium]
MTPAISVVLADDHTLVREMLHDRLRREGMEIAGVASAGDEAVRLAATTHPDVVILDIDMPGISAFEAARLVRAASPATRIVFLSAYVHDGYIDQALVVEASGYLTKSEPPDAIVEAIRKVHRGETSFSPAVLARLVVDSAGIRLGSAVQTRYELLTEREREILGYVARGLLQKQIARQAGISVKTVQHHITHTMDKLEIHDRVELARFAIREGLIEA